MSDDNNTPLNKNPQNDDIIKTAKKFDTNDLLDELLNRGSKNENNKEPSSYSENYEERASVSSVSSDTIDGLESVIHKYNHKEQDVAPSETVSEKSGDSDYSHSDLKYLTLKKSRDKHIEDFNESKDFTLNQDIMFTSEEVEETDEATDLTFINVIPESSLLEATDEIETSIINETLNVTNEFVPSVEQELKQEKEDKPKSLKNENKEVSPKSTSINHEKLKEWQEQSKKAKQKDMDINSVGEYTEHIKGSTMVFSLNDLKKKSWSRQFFCAILFLVSLAV